MERHARHCATDRVRSPDYATFRLFALLPTHPSSLPRSGCPRQERGRLIPLYVTRIGVRSNSCRHAFSRQTNAYTPRSVTFFYRPSALFRLRDATRAPATCISTLSSLSDTAGHGWQPPSSHRFIARRAPFFSRHHPPTYLPTDRPTYLAIHGREVSTCFRNQRADEPSSMVIGSTSIFIGGVAVRAQHLQAIESAAHSRPSNSIELSAIERREIQPEEMGKGRGEATARESLKGGKAGGRGEGSRRGACLVRVERVSRAVGTFRMPAGGR